jgi:hypothetical protein
MRLASCVACLVLVTATLAYAQAGARPTRSVGDTWTFTNDQVVRIVKVDENGEVQVRPKSPCPTCSWVTDKDFTLLQVLGEDGKPTDASKFGFLGIGMKFFDFPLEVKKTWRIETHGLFRGDNVPYIIDCTVSAFEDVKTKAGTFKAFKIDRSWRVRVSTGPSPTWSDTAWWSPDTKSVVKFETGSRNVRPFELESYKITP